MGGRMTTLKESRKSVETYQADQRLAKGSRRRRSQSEFSVGNRVMRVEDRRLGTIRGVIGGEVYVVRWVDDDTREQVEGSRLVSRFTTQTTGFTPKGAERAEITEETAA